MVRLAEDRFETELVGYMRDLFRYGLKLAGNTTDAEDITQEAYKNALDRRHTYQDGTNLRAWLFSIQYNAYRDLARRRYRQTSRETVNEDAVAAYPQLPTQHDRVMFIEAGEMIKSLPRDHRQALYLVAFDGLTYAEAARELEISEGTVKSRVARARAALWEMLNEPEPEPVARDVPAPRF